MFEGIKEKFSSDKRKLWLIIILILLLILALLFNFLFRRYISQKQANQNSNLNQYVPINTSANNGTFNRPNPKVLADLKATQEIEDKGTASQQANAVFIASSFAERFGSYSNQSDFKNLDELESFMTASMSAWVKTYKVQLQKANPDFNVYYAIETKAISTEIRTLDESIGKGEILVKTQRQEFKNTINNPKVFYQDIKLDLLKESGGWKVDGAYWQ